MCKVQHSDSHWTAELSFCYEHPMTRIKPAAKINTVKDPKSAINTSADVTPTGGQNVAVCLQT